MGTIKGLVCGDRPLNSILGHEGMPFSFWNLAIMGRSGDARCYGCRIADADECSLRHVRGGCGACAAANVPCFPTAGGVGRGPRRGGRCLTGLKKVRFTRSALESCASVSKAGRFYAHLGHVAASIPRLVSSCSVPSAPSSPPPASPPPVSSPASERSTSSGLKLIRKDYKFAPSSVSSTKTLPTAKALAPFVSSLELSLYESSAHQTKVVYRNKIVYRELRVKALPAVIEGGGLPELVLIDDQCRQSVAIKQYLRQCILERIDAKRRFGVKGSPTSTNEDALAHTTNAMNPLKTPKTSVQLRQELDVLVTRKRRSDGSVARHRAGIFTFTKLAGDKGAHFHAKSVAGKPARRQGRETFSDEEPNYAVFDGGMENSAEAIQEPGDLVM